MQQPGLNNPRSRSIPIVSTCFNPVKDFEAGTLCQSTPTYPTIAPCLLKVCHSSRDVVETAGSFQPWSVGKGTRDFRILVKNLFHHLQIESGAPEKLRRLDKRTKSRKDHSWWTVGKEVILECPCLAATYYVYKSFHSMQAQGPVISEFGSKHRSLHVRNNKHE